MSDLFLRDLALQDGKRIDPRELFPVVDPPSVTFMDLQIQLREDVQNYASAVMLSASPMTLDRVASAHRSVQSYIEECSKMLTREYLKQPPRAVVFIVDPGKIEDAD